MRKGKDFFLKPWMIIVTLAAIIMIVSGFDPAGDILKRSLGQNADRWATNALLIVLIAYAFIARK